MQLLHQAVEQGIEAADRGIEGAQVTLVFGQQEAALRRLRIEHDAQIAGQQRLTLLGGGDLETRLVHALVARLGDHEKGRDEGDAEQDRRKVEPD